MRTLKPTANPTPDEFKGLHKFMMWVVGFFFIYLVLEACFLLPYCFLRYGMH